MARMGKLFGANEETFMGLAGVGDTHSALAWDPFLATDRWAFD